MDSIYQLRQQASVARKQGDIQTALSQYRQLWYSFPEDRSAWDGWGYAWCLYRLKDYALALTMIKEARELDPEHEPLKSLEAWCRYQILFASEKLPGDLDHHAQMILDLCNPQEAMSPYQRTVFKLLAHYAQPFQASALQRWLSQLNPADLSKETDVIQQGQRELRLPSPWLRYMGKLSEYLFQTGDYQGCLASCADVLKSPREQLARGQRIWFERRQARCQIEMKQYDQAIKAYHSLLKFKSDWFLYKELAEALSLSGRHEDALQAALTGLFAPGEREKKIHLLSLLAQTLDVLNHADMAQQTRESIVLIRQEQNWSMPQELQTVAHQLKPDISLQSHWKTLLQLLQTLRPTESEAKQKHDSSEIVEGKIQKILPHGQAGFIRLHDGRSIYFRAQDAKKLPELKEGLAVKCKVKEGYDAKKQCNSWQAVEIEWSQQSK